MGKYRNKDGIELNYTSKDTHTELVKEVAKKESFIIFNRDQDVLKISIKSIENQKFIISFNFLSLIK